jgi:N-acetylglutamate synthase-like GNAT family acetyltransferase
VKVRKATDKDAQLIAEIVSESNKDVAIKFRLDVNNCPKHPSFYNAGRVKADFNRGEQYFILENGVEVYDCVAIECPNDDALYLNRLSVLPACRQQGYGRNLVEFVIKQAKSASATVISIGIIGEHAELLKWYKKLGFMPTETRRFPHLPFTVQYMTYQIT